LRGLDLEWAASLMSEPSLLVDGRNALDPELAMAAALRYRSFGVAEAERTSSTREGLEKTLSWSAGRLAETQEAPTSR
jgi:hypothetical protein